MLKSLIKKIKRKLGIKIRYQSETSKVRHLVIDFCIGKGADVGFGGDKIKKTDCLGIDLPVPYAYTGKDKVDIPCNIGIEEIYLPDSSLDFLYSSHLIEDFEDTVSVLNKFIRVLKDKGTLILVFPDQSVYEEHCNKTGQPLNIHHIHEEMGLKFMKEQLFKSTAAYFEILYESNCEIDYNVILIIKIFKDGKPETV